MTDATRPAPPDLEFETPPCSVCCTATEFIDHSFGCSPCGITWPQNGQDGEWDATQCPAVVKRPLGTIHCYRAAGHTSHHVSPDWLASPDDWEVPSED